MTGDASELTIPLRSVPTHQPRASTWDGRPTPTTAGEAAAAAAVVAVEVVEEAVVVAVGMAEEVAEAAAAAAVMAGAVGRLPHTTAGPQTVGPTGHGRGRIPLVDTADIECLSRVWW